MFIWNKCWTTCLSSGGHFKHKELFYLVFNWGGLTLNCSAYSCSADGQCYFTSTSNTWHTCPPAFDFWWHQFKAQQCEQSPSNGMTLIIMASFNHFSFGYLLHEYQKKEILNKDFGLYLKYDDKFHKNGFERCCAVGPVWFQKMFPVFIFYFSYS